jgi:hypothetical protein
MKVTNLVNESANAFPLVGLFYRPDEVKAMVKALGKYTLVAVNVEPDNAYDKNALKVTLLDDTHIGYIGKPDQYRFDLTEAVTGFCVFMKNTRGKDLLIYLGSIEVEDFRDAEDLLEEHKLRVLALEESPRKEALLKMLETLIGEEV